MTALATTVHPVLTTARDTLRRHWPEYLIEAVGLGAFMISAAVFASLLEHPASPLRPLLPDGTVRRALMGVAMGATALTIITSPWGRRSGAHINPAVTLAFLRLRKIAPADALFYVLAQFTGGVAGLLLAGSVLGAIIRAPEVHWVATVPGPAGHGAAFATEAGMAFVHLLAVLLVSNSARLTRFTGLVAAAMVALWISVAAPISGMSINPARTFASAVPAVEWTGWWIYFTAPPLGMLLATAAWQALARARAPACAKLQHDLHSPCIFSCRFAELVRGASAPTTAPAPSPVPAADS